MDGIKVTVIPMTSAEYTNRYGERYANGELWDYPVSELPYLVYDRPSEETELRVALVKRDDEYRLCELPE